jgi:aminoglycoside phosphotransferase (APT) family kinase protein
MAKMHPHEVNINIRLVRRLLATQFPQWARLPIEPVLPSGTDNALYRLGNEMVMRLPRRERPSQTLDKECQWLPRLAPHLPLAIPIPQAHGTPAEGYPFPWSVYGWLKGENATINSVTDMNQLATDLARFLTSLQRIDTTGGPPPGPHNFFRGAPLGTQDNATRAAIASLGRTIDGDVVTAAWDGALRAHFDARAGAETALMRSALPQVTHRCPKGRRSISESRCAPRSNRRLIESGP